MADVWRMLGERSADACRPLADALQSPHLALLVGPGKSGRTSLLFQACVSRASEGVHVVFIAPSRDKVDASIPLLRRGAAAGREALERIEMRYLAKCVLCVCCVCVVCAQTSSFF